MESGQEGFREELDEYARATEEPEGEASADHISALWESVNLPPSEPNVGGGQLSKVRRRHRFRLRRLCRETTALTALTPLTTLSATRIPSTAPAVPSFQN